MASTNNGSITGVANRYGRALFELVHEQGAAAAAFTHIEGVRKALTPELLAFLSSLAAPATKEAVLLAVAEKLGLPLLLKHFLQLVVRKGRGDALPAILAAALALEDARNGVVHARVLSAVALTKAQEKQVEGFVKTQSHAKEVVLQAVVDKSLIAGVRLEVGAIAYDSSLKSRLEQMKTTLRQPVGAEG